MKEFDDNILFSLMNLFDLFETSFISSVSGFAGGDPSRFGGRSTPTVIISEDIRSNIRDKKDFELSHLP
ncbi:hypothetical protein Hanom_Chr17g01526181 [Helianthus anomalus]